MLKQTLNSLSLFVLFFCCTHASAKDISNYQVNSNAYSNLSVSGTQSDQLWNQSGKPTGATGNILYGGIYKRGNGACQTINIYTGGCSCPSGYSTTVVQLYDGNAIYFCSKRG